MELGKAVFFCEIRVVESHYLVNIEFAGELASDPAISEVHESDVVFFQVGQHSRINLFNHGFHLVENFVHTRLVVSIVVLHVINQLRQTPKDVSLDSKDAFLSQSLNLLFSEFDPGKPLFRHYLLLCLLQRIFLFDSE